MRVARLAVAGAILSLACARLADAQVYLRGRTEPVSGEIVALDWSGVSVRSGAAKAETISWDRVRGIRGEQQLAAEPFIAAAEQLWRARSRVERGDVAGAEPILESLAAAADERAFQGASAAVLQENLLRCRLERGAQAGATRALIGMWAQRPDLKSATGRAASAGAAIDPATGLVPGLSPMFVRDAPLEAAARELADPAATSASGAPLAKLYAIALRVDAGEQIAWSSELTRGVPAPGWIVAEIVQSRTGNPEERAAARTALANRLRTPDMSAWLEAWCHVGIGRSLIREADESQRREGVLHLLQAPARLGRSAGYLASLALREAAETMDALGEADAAAALKAELRDRYGRWPAARGVAAEEQRTEGRG